MTALQRLSERNRSKRARARLARITSVLPPLAALVLYAFQPAETRLRRSSAGAVQILHRCAALTVIEIA